jgi:hypothetical protein
MSIVITVSDTVSFKVKGTINDAGGIAQPFDFKLTCNRLDADALDARVKANNDETFVDFLADVVEDWGGVRDGENKPIAYTEDALRQLCKIAGVARVAWIAYLTEVGAKTKN